MRDRKITLNIMLPSKYSYMIQTFLPPFPFPLPPLPLSLTLSLPLSALCFLPPSPPEKAPEPLGGLQIPDGLVVRFGLALAPVTPLRPSDTGAGDRGGAPAEFVVVVGTCRKDVGSVVLR
jgi:hypothetical protein